MTIYCVDDGGDGSQTNSTQSASTLDWSKADTSLANLISYDAAALTTGGNVIYIGDDHNEPAAGGNKTYTGPTSGIPVILISADRTQSTPTYKVGTGDQLKSSDGAYTMTFDGAFTSYGVRLEPGSTVTASNDSDEAIAFIGCTFVMPAGGTITLSGSTHGAHVMRNCVVDLTLDASARTALVFTLNNPGMYQFEGLTFVAPNNRTGTIFGGGAAGLNVLVSGCDFSGFTNATLCEVIAGPSGGIFEFANCKTAATWGPADSTALAGSQRYTFINCGNTDSPSYIYEKTYWGVVASSAIYRTGGATAGGVATSWQVQSTTASVSEASPLRTPWMYGNLAASGTKTFDIYITNDTADFTDAEVWLEVQYLKDSGSGLWTLASDQRTITTAASAQTDDTGSTWNGAGPSYTYMQKLSCASVSVGQAGQYRARVAVGVASIADARKFYIDPFVTVS